MIFNNLIFNFDAPTSWGIFFQDSATPQIFYIFLYVFIYIFVWSGKSLNRGWKLPNSGEFLKFLILNLIWKYKGGWSNYSGKVISQKMRENKIDNRGSKSDNYISVKEQRVDGSCIGFKFPMFRYTLTGFERNFIVKILTNQIANKPRLYSINCNVNDNFKIDPYFLTGFTDAEGSFVLSITKSNNTKSGWVVKPRFQIHLHEKDLQLLYSIQSFLKVGRIDKQNSDSYQFRVDSLSGIKVIIDHFDKYPLISQKFSDYQLFKQAYLLWLNKEHLTPEGLSKIVAIKASINNGLTLELKKSFPNIIPVFRPVKDEVNISNPYWLAGFVSGEGCFMVRIRDSKSSSKAIIELVFQVNQHVRDKNLMGSIAEYLECGKIYKHSSNVVVFKVSKLFYINNNIVTFFTKYPILGVKYKDFKDFCLVVDMLNKKEHLTKEGLNQIRKIKNNMNTGRNIINE